MISDYDTRPRLDYLILIIAVGFLVHISAVFQSFMGLETNKHNWEPYFVRERKYAHFHFVGVVSFQHHRIADIFGHH